MKTRTKGLLLVAVGLALMLYGAAPALGLSGLSTNTTPCPSTIWFYTLSTTGTVGTTPIGEVHLLSAAQAAAAWQVAPSAWTGLSATYNSLSAPVVPYVASTSPTTAGAGYIVGTWGSYNGAFYSDSLGQYNSDGSCSNPGGIYIPPATSTSTTAATSVTVVSTSASSTSSLTSTGSVTFTTTSVTLKSSTVTSTIRGQPPSTALSSSEGYIVLAGVVVLLAGVYVTRKKGSLVG
jgi:hypothetical protein